MNDGGLYRHLMCYRSKDGRTIFVRVHIDREVDVVDTLMDGGYRVGQCAGWYYHAQLVDGHPERQAGAVVFDVEGKMQFDPK